MGANYKRRDPGPCPDPEKYILVRTKEGDFWRRKRGTLTPARLNASFQKNVTNSKVAAPAAKRVIQKLRPFLRELQTGRLNVWLTAAFIKAINENGRPDFSYLQGFDLHEYPLKKLLTGGYTVQQNESDIKIKILIDAHTMKRHSVYVTDYYFEAILLYGDVAESNGLRIDSVLSPLYSFTSTHETECVLTLDLPPGNQPWIVLLKATCQMQNGPYTDLRGHGMQVVAVGG